MNSKAIFSSAVFFLSVVFSLALYPQGAEAFAPEDDPFGFSSRQSLVSAYSFGPFLKVDDEVRPELGFRPLFYMKRETDIGSLSLDILYPLFHYKKHPSGFQAGFFFNSISFGNSADIQSGFPERSFRIYPFIFYRNSANPERKHFSIVPFYGKFGSKIKFVLFPLYLQTRSSEGVSRNVLWPFFAFYSDGYEGFRFWPFYGRVKKKNYRFRFALWPLYFDRETDQGGIYQRYKGLFPFYYRFDYLTESHRIYLWPLFQRSVDPARNMKSFHLPWPFINFKTGDREKRIRFFPFFEKSETTGFKKTSFFLWPLYVSSRVNFNKHEYQRKSFLIIFKIKREIPFEQSENSSLQVDLWPVFSYKRDRRGSDYFHMLSPLEPVIGSSEKLYRNYSFLWKALEVRRKKGRGTAVSALFGTLMFKKSCEENSFHLLGKALGYSSDLSGRKIRFLFLPVKIAGPSKRAEDCPR